ncbi:hypothetical protein Q5P01_003427 [Channa striata]|uniref:Uncharacterized protein n=1 Tax=Channa striata TaxID=64152 RepID=A0AA88NJM8_CHASR|nr:hypothetical protein Q5P01_003427 [Channa striata]
MRSGVSIKVSARRAELSDREKTRRSKDRILNPGRKCLHITESPLDCSSSSSSGSRSRPADGLKGVKVREGSGTLTG